MNNTDPFALVENRALEPVKAAPQADLELQLLRAFFDAWEALHAIKGDKRHPEIREKHQIAAQVLVDAAHAVRALKNG